MTSIEPGYVPTFSARTRTAVYVGALLANVVIMAVLAVLLILEVVPTVTAIALCAVAAWAILTISNGFAVGYRPTRPDVLATLDNAAVLHDGTWYDPKRD